MTHKVDTNLQIMNTGGRTMKRGRGRFVKGWAKIQPGYHDRTLMLKRCGKKCFLGPNKTFPICARRTCKINRKGVYAAYMRGREYMSKTGKSKYRRITAKARKIGETKVSSMA